MELGERASSNWICCGVVRGDWAKLPLSQNTPYIVFCCAIVIENSTTNHSR